jgi:hypothetical protein
MNDPFDPSTVRLEEKLMFLEERVATLDAALTRESAENARLTERVRVIERALQTLASRTAPRTPGEIQGAFTVDDPVPHSG